MIEDESATCVETRNHYGKSLHLRLIVLHIIHECQNERKIFVYVKAKKNVDGLCATQKRLVSMSHAHLCVYQNILTLNEPAAAVSIYNIDCATMTTATTAMIIYAQNGIN